MSVEAYKRLYIIKPFNQIGYFSGKKSEEIYQELKPLLKVNGIYALTGMVGSGKTTLLARIQDELSKEKSVIVSSSLNIEKNRFNTASLFSALFADLSEGDKKFKATFQGERRERLLVELMKKHGKPVVLFIDEAHDIHSRTFVAFKRIIETVTAKRCNLSIVLAGHPKLGNMLQSANMEEIGARTKIFSIDMFEGERIRYINWLFKQVLNPKHKRDEVITKEAIEKLAHVLRTPLQINYCLDRAIIAAHQCGETHITPELIEKALLADINSLEANLARLGYQIPDLCELLNATKKEIKQFLSNKPDFMRKDEFMQKLHDRQVMNL